MTRVLIAAASAIVRAGLESIVQSSPSVEVVGTATGAAALAERIEVAEPDVVLLDIEGGGTHSSLSVPRFDRQSVRPSLVVLTADTDEIGPSEALRLGAHAILPRDAEPQEIIAAIEAAAVGLIVLHASSFETLLPFAASAPRAGSASTSSADALTQREIEVLTLLAEGVGNKMIARQLGISEHTVKFHVGSILSKLGASSRTEAVTAGVRRGLIMV